MTYFVTYDPVTTLVIGRYDSLIENPPQGSHYIEVSSSEEMMQTFPSGWRVVDNQLLPPPPPDPQQTLASNKNSRKFAIRQSCAYNIESGFSHSISNQSFRYSSKITDQLNINNAAQIGGNLWRAYNTNWEFVAHSIEDAQAVQKSLWQHIQQCQSQLNTLYANIDAATTVEAVDAIQWTEIE